MRAITSDRHPFVCGTIETDEDFDPPTPTPTRLARGSSGPQCIVQLLDAAKQHSDMMIRAAHDSVMSEIDHAIGHLTRAEYDTLLGRVVQSIARRRVQRDNG